MKNKPNYKILEERDLPKSAKEIDLEIPAEDFDQYIDSKLRKFTAEAELPGFRKGKAPQEIVLKNIGEMRVLEEAANDIINEAVFAVLAEKKVKFIGQPSISITTLAKSNPLRFKMQYAIVPEFSLPDYRTIAAEINDKKDPDATLSEEELNASLLHIRRIISGTGQEKEPPELTDESVKKLGNFASVTEFTEKLKNDLIADKKQREKEKRVLTVIEKIVNETKFDVPEALTEHELDRIEAEFSQDLERMGQKKEAYLKKINKTVEQLREDWKESAEKRAKFELLMPRIAKEEKISVPQEEVEHEIKHLLEHYKGADKESAKLYVERALLRQKVVQFLETFRKTVS